MLQRREFLRTGLVLGAAAAAPQAVARPPVARLDPDDWESIRAEFDLEPGLRHFSGFFLASHPRTVRDAIARHRARLDANPIAAWHDQGGPGGKFETAAREAAAAYLGVEAGGIALTDSTTMGLGLMYAGIRLREGQEVLSTTHDHYATSCSLQFRAQRAGCKVRRIQLYANPASATVDEIASNLEKALTPATRVVAVTWVHSSTGVKLPIRALADAVARANQGRDDNERALLCVDGVHGLGVEDVTLPDLGCDFFAAGTHKWIFGPRGTGIWWGAPSAWAHVDPMIPPFNSHVPPGLLHTPGGFHSFEHRWALPEAFNFHLVIGKARVQRRTHELNTAIKAGLAAMPHVTLYTPKSEALSAGIVSFDVKGMQPDEVVERLHARHIVASESPYTPSCARLAASLLTNESDVEAALAAVRDLA